MLPRVERAYKPPLTCPASRTSFRVMRRAKGVMKPSKVTGTKKREATPRNRATTSPRDELAPWIMSIESASRRRG